LAKSGYPVLADGLYGKENTLPQWGLLRHALHAARLEFEHPATGARVVFEAPLASDMKEALRKLRTN
jgi:23S rRNA-/tRNA-specific pseudouridylate synthase